jgi:hypothetical protein
MKISVPRYDRPFGLPDRAITFSNSERKSLSCPRQWYLRHVEHLDGGGAGRAMKWGTAWHTVQEDIHIHWRDTDDPYEIPRLHRENGPLRKIRSEWLAQAAESEFAQTYLQEANEDLVRLTRAAEGYLVRFGGGPLAQLKVVDVEVQLAAPVPVPKTRRPYRPASLLLRCGDRLELAGTSALGLHSPEDLQWVRWPYYQVGTLDVIYEHRRSGDLYVGELKTSGSPQQYIDWLTVDPQVSGYGWLLKHALANGWKGLGDRKVEGYFYEVANSKKQNDPDLLKSGKLSKSRARKPPSWRYAAAILAHGLDPNEYREHLEYLRDTVDPKIYLREWGSLSDETFTRYETEIYAIAQRIAQGRRDAVRAKFQEDLDVAFPRFQRCQSLGAFCDMKAPCVQDGEIVRKNYILGEGLQWRIEQEELW